MLNNGKLDDILRFIDALPLSDTTKSEAKFILIAQRVDRLSTQDDLEKFSMRLTIRFGVIIAAGVGVLATLIKLL